jgi:hypothetical protein
LAVWLALVIIGFAIKALLWLAIAGIVLFVATSIYGVIRRRTRRACRTRAVERSPAAPDVRA